MRDRGSRCSRLRDGRAGHRDWTIVVPPRLTDGPRTGHYREALDVNVRSGLSISRADVADYIVKDLARATPQRGLAFIAY
jgi:putative NADH-flavin reductase